MPGSTIFPAMLLGGVKATDKLISACTMVELLKKTDYEITKFIWGCKLLRYRLYLCNVKMSGFLEKKNVKNVRTKKC
jgi:hypothetical protein